MASDRVIFLFDVDNTLVDNDRIVADLMKHLEREMGHERQQRYWAIFEELRTTLGYADYLGALQQYRIQYPRDFNILTVSHYLVNYPFANRLFPNSLDVVERCQQFGRTVILSDGDVVFQPQKVHRSGLYETFDGEVLIYIHKEQELDDVRRFYPADHYVLIDDKVRILSAVKTAWGDAVTTVFPRQGHYALDAEEVAKYPPADIELAAISELMDHDLSSILARR